MKYQLGVEMTVLGEDDRTRLMNGMILRRLTKGAPRTRHQLDVALSQDLFEITRKFSTFDFKTYTDSDLEEFLTSMVEAKLIDRRDGEKEEDPQIYERGAKADEFHQDLTEEMGWMIEDLPMSTRGVFDSLKSRPSRQVTMTPQEYYDKHHSGKDGPEKLVEDTKRHDPRDHQLKA